MTDNTIYALSTAFAKSGTALVRVSGPLAKQSLLRLTGLTESKIAPRRAVLSKIYSVEPDDAGSVNYDMCEIIDHALVLYFEAPQSFTGENVAEYHLHGSVAVIQSMLDALQRQPGHRLAEPGEFTRRGFENSKFDLTEAEAIADLIDAETKLQKNQALSQLEGSLSSLYMSWHDRLLNASAYVEAEIDFSDEDLPDGIANETFPVLRDVLSEIDEHLNDNKRGERLRDGVKIAIIGAPNAGKSSLINALSKRDVAIVSSHAGTTRDIIDVNLDLGGVPVIVSDTAGLRPDQLGSEAHDEIESEGIKRALSRAESSDLRILVFDAENLPDLCPHTEALINDNALIVFNKCDLYQGDLPIEGSISLSIETRQGLDALLGELETRARALIGSSESPTLTRKRHRKALEECTDFLHKALSGQQEELIAEDIRLAVRSLGYITGRVDVEDLLDVIFHDFCIGK